MLSTLLPVGKTKLYKSASIFCQQLLINSSSALSSGVLQVYFKQYSRASKPLTPQQTPMQGQALHPPAEGNPASSFHHPDGNFDPTASEYD